MRFSLSLPRPTDDAGAEAIDDAIEIAAHAEHLGLHAVSASDHPFPAVAPGEAGHQAFDPFVLLATVGAATSHIHLHFSLIVSPYRNPFLTARSLATLDLATRGRVIAGMGAGYLAAEFRALGASLEGRAARVADDIEAMTTAWLGEPVHAKGDGWEAVGNSMLPRPASRPRPAIWRGGNALAAIDHAVRACDGWTPFEVNAVGSRLTASKELSLETLPARMALLGETIERHGRTEPLDVCYVRTSRRWLAEDATIFDDLSQLAELGVTWLEFTVPGSEPLEVADHLERFTALAGEAGVLDPR